MSKDEIVARIAEAQAELEATPKTREYHDEIARLHDELRALNALAAEAGAFDKPNVPATVDAARARLSELKNERGRIPEMPKNAPWIARVDAEIASVTAELERLESEAEAERVAAEKAAAETPEAQHAARMAALEARRADAAVRIEAGDASARDEFEAAEAEIAEVAHRERIRLFAVAEQERRDREAAAAAAAAEAQRKRAAYEESEAEFAAAFDKWLVTTATLEKEARSMFAAHHARRVAGESAGMSGSRFQYAHMPIIRVVLRALANAGAPLPDLFGFDYDDLKRTNRDYPLPVKAEPKPRAGCSVCSHEASDAIDAALAEGNSLRQIEAAFGPSRSALSDHKRLCLQHKENA